MNVSAAAGPLRLESRREPEVRLTDNLPVGTACRHERGLTLISVSEARRTLLPLIERINADRDWVEIVSRHGNAVLMPADESHAWKETAYWFRSPANARRLLEAYERAKSGETEQHALDWEDHLYWQKTDRRVLDGSAL